MSLCRSCRHFKASIKNSIIVQYSWKYEGELYVRSWNTIIQGIIWRKNFGKYNNVTMRLATIARTRVKTTMGLTSLIMVMRQSVSHNWRRVPYRSPIYLSLSGHASIVPLPHRLSQGSQRYRNRPVPPKRACQPWRESAGKVRLSHPADEGTRWLPRNTLIDGR